MQADEMPSIERHQNAVLGDGESQYVLIRRSLASLSALIAGQRIVSQSPQFLNNRHGEVFVRV